MNNENKSKMSGMQYLSVDGMQKIHEQALLILEKTGIQVEHETALKMLADAGAQVNFETQNVKFPVSLVEQCLASSPRSVLLAARDPNKDLVLEPGGKMYTRNTGGMAHIRDIDTNEVRDVTIKDTGDYTRLIDGLNNIDMVTPLFATDVSPQTRELKVLEAMLHNTVKHTNIRVLTRKNLKYVAEIGMAIAGSKDELRKRPYVSILEGPIPPLRFPDVMVDALLLGGEYGIPIEICSMPNIGATGPITLAGSLLLTIAEHLASFVVGEVAHKGTPIIWAPRYPNMDMATGMTGMCVEGAIVCAAAAQMVREKYGMVCDLHGPANNAVIPDAQAAMEGSFAFITAFAGRPNILCGAGGLELGLVGSFTQLVLDNEIHSVVRRALEGFEVSDEMLGADAIARVGIGGNYLRDEHTIRHLRSERYFLKLLKPQTRDGWTTAGLKDLTTRATERAREIFEKHQTAYLEEEITKR
ncbi:MAG: trimethylamine methyltransferase family protein, partial [Chloroflexota bacterium]